MTSLGKLTTKSEDRLLKRVLQNHVIDPERKADRSFLGSLLGFLLNTPLNCSLMSKMALNVKTINHLRSHSTPSFDRRENEGSKKGSNLSSHSESAWQRQDQNSACFVQLLKYLVTTSKVSNHGLG